jgi:hypothetical protein
MNVERRTAFAALVAALLWAFFFVPNGLFGFLEIQGNERLPTFVFFAVIPASLGVFLALALKRERMTTALVTVGVPLFGIAASLTLWLIGYYSSESLLRAWLLCLWPIPAYALGVVLGLWLRIRLPRAASS